MLRSNIIYACETYYGLTEYQIRQIERIEEQYLRKLFKTSKGCPIAQLHLESGHIPARFQIFKSRLLFLKYILEQDPKSLLNTFLTLQLKFPTRGDWASSCLQDLKYLEIELRIEEIREGFNKKKMSNLGFWLKLGEEGSEGKPGAQPVIRYFSIV